MGNRLEEQSSSNKDWGPGTPTNAKKLGQRESLKKQERGHYGERLRSKVQGNGRMSRGVKAPILG